MQNVFIITFDLVKNNNNKVFPFSHPSLCLAPGPARKRGPAPRLSLLAAAAVRPACASRLGLSPAVPWPSSSSGPQRHLALSLCQLGPTRQSSSPTSVRFGRMRMPQPPQDLPPARTAMLPGPIKALSRAPCPPSEP